MRMIIDRDAAFAAVGAVQSVADKKCTIPIVQSVLIQAAHEGVTVSATNLDIWASADAPAESDQPGAFALSADKLYDLLRNLPSGGEVVIEMADGGPSAQVICGRSRTKLFALPATDFPQTTPPADKVERVVLRADALLRLIERVAFAASADETRFMLTGVHLSLERRGERAVIRSAGLSTRMIAWAEMDVGEAALAMPTVSLGRRLVTELRRLLDGATAEVALDLTRQRFSLAFAGRSIVAKLLDGEPPSYWQYFEAPPPLSIEVATAELKMALKRCLMMADDKDRAVRVQVERDAVRFSARSYALGEADEEIAASWSAEPMSFAVNGAQLLEIAGQITGNRMVMRLHETPSVLVVDDLGDPACGYLTSMLRG